MASRLISTILFLCLFTFFAFHNFSIGDAYFSRLQDFNQAVKEKNWSRARSVERSISSKDVQHIKESFFPEYLEINIAKLSSKLNPTIDTYLQIAQLYLQLEDKNNAILNLKQAQKIDPIRQDIGQLIRSLQ